MNDNIINIEYNQTGKSTVVDQLGMREMQSRAFSARNAQYLLLKAPPASGKSRAMMYLALDKLKTGSVKKVIIAVPEKTIAKSFADTDLTSSGFHTDWSIEPKYNLCIAGGETRKVAIFKSFLESDSSILLCTHATLRFAFSDVGCEKFNNCLIGIDEFHHVSADEENRLGELIREIMNQTNAHIVAMTGSYFRGDRIPVLDAAYESKFTKVSYNYYEQLNGCKYLKSLGIDFHFYQGKYTDSIGEVINTDKKTIIHIPNVNSGESTSDKYDEVDRIIDSIGEFIEIDDVGLIHVRRKDGKILKIADLVNDDERSRSKIVEYLRNIQSPDDVDIIIALGMAKEGFDWTYCEHALTVGYRGSLTEIIQIIGRCTRDCPGKEHAQFTNMVAYPDAEDETIVESVNNLLKAITASLLMEQVMAPTISFKPVGEASEGDVAIVGMKSLNNKELQDVLTFDRSEIETKILQDDDIKRAIASDLPPEVINKVLIPKVIENLYPDLDSETIEALSQNIVTGFVLRNVEVERIGNDRFIKMCDELVNVEFLDIDLIESVNPFKHAFDVLSKKLTPRLLKAVQNCIHEFTSNMTFEEARYWWPQIKAFKTLRGRLPSLDSNDRYEKRMAEAIIFLRREKERLNAGQVQ